MRLPLVGLGFLLATVGIVRAAGAGTSYRDDFAGDLKQWAVEQMPGGTAVVENGALDIQDVGGSTVWFRPKLTAPVVITYEVTVVSQGGPHDRVSDLNCFWMAADPKAPDGCPFAAGHGRTGKFSDYDSLFTYYVGYGGNSNTTTRFRRYDGTAARPLLPEHDLSDTRFMLVPNHTYRIKLVAHDGVAEFWRDDEKIFSLRDPAPLAAGWFGFRTVRSHLSIRKFRVEQTPTAAAIVPARELGSWSVMLLLRGRAHTNDRYRMADRSCYLPGCPSGVEQACPRRRPTSPVVGDKLLKTKLYLPEDA